MYPTDLEDLVKWWLSNDSRSYVLDDLQSITIHSVLADEVRITVHYGSNYLYRDDFTFNHTEMILAYINSRFEELLPSVR